MQQRLMERETKRKKEEKRKKSGANCIGWKPGSIGRWLVAGIALVRRLVGRWLVAGIALVGRRVGTQPGRYTAYTLWRGPGSQGGPGRGQGGPIEGVNMGLDRGITKKKTSKIIKRVKKE